MQLLADEVDADKYATLINAETRPLIMVHVPQMAKQVMAMKLEKEHEEWAEDLRNTPIEEIIREQNVTSQSFSYRGRNSMKVKIDVGDVGPE